MLKPVNTVSSGVFSVTQVIQHVALRHGRGKLKSPKRSRSKAAYSAAASVDLHHKAQGLAVFDDCTATKIILNTSNKNTQNIGCDGQLATHTGAILAISNITDVSLEASVETLHSLFANRLLDSNRLVKDHLMKSVKFLFRIEQLEKSQSLPQDHPAP